MIIGIAGGTGSGKTTVVRRITENLPHGVAVVLPQDAYYFDNSHLPLTERQKINFDHPDSIEFNLLIEHINLLKNNLAIEQPLYSYLTCSRLNETISIHPHDVVIVEGILIFTHEPLRKLFDLKIFVDADADDRLMRVIKRDMNERGRDAIEVLDRYEKTVKLMHDQFIEPTKRFADVIVPQGGNNHVAIKLLTNYIKNYQKTTH